MKKALITGITGQDGSYLAEFLLSKDYEVHGIIRRASTFNTSRIDHIYVDPHKPGARLFLHYGDLSDSEQISNIIYNIKPDEVYHLGAQTHVRVSFDIPEYSGNVTGLGTTRILEAIRRSGNKIRFYQASSSEMFGESKPPQNEQTPFKPRSPYACSKVYAYWMAVNYREGYNIFACNGVLFNHECIASNTPIIIRRRNTQLIDILPVEEIVPHREDPSKGKKYVTANDNDLGVWDGNKWTRIRVMTATWNDAGAERDLGVHRIVCRGGYYEATADHISFLKGEKQVKTKNIREGDYLELKSFPSLTKAMSATAEEAEFLGMMTADGYISEEGKGRFVNEDKNLRNRISELWKKIAGGYTKETTHPSGFTGREIASIELFGNRDYLRLIRKEIYTEKGLKKVPSRILNAPIDVIKHFVYGYNICDGLKAGNQKTILKSFTTNSSVLALGLWYLVSQAFGLRVTLHPEFRDDRVYFHLNINSDNNSKGQHLKKLLEEVKKVLKVDYSGWLFDLETESGTFSAGLGLTWIHNSPRRGETFVTRKITRAIANILADKQKKLYLGNLDAKRDWGFAPEYVEFMHKMLQSDKPEDLVLGTAESHSVREFVKEAFSYVDLDWEKYVKIDPRYFRPTEVQKLIADSTKAKKNLDWQPKIRFKELVKIMVDADIRKTGLTPPGEGDKILKEKIAHRWWKVN